MKITYDGNKLTWSTRWMWLKPWLWPLLIRRDRRLSVLRGFEHRQLVRDLQEKDEFLRHIVARAWPGHPMTRPGSLVSVGINGTVSQALAALVAKGNK